MKCPTCSDTPLVMAERQGVEIDDCPACRGIWLDRGELDKLLDRVPSVQPNSGMPPPSGHGDSRDRYSDRDRYKPKKSWLHDIFD